MRQYRANAARFVMDEAAAFTRLDRNQRVRLLVAVEGMERATKRHGCRNGIIGLPGVAVLRALLFRFHNTGTGRCCPSYDAIQRATGLCRASIARALAALEAIGAVKVARRIVRIRMSSGGVLVRQGVNLYGFGHMPRLIPLPEMFTMSMAASRRSPPRVHQTGTNQVRAGQEAIEMTRTRVSSDWRANARAMFSKIAQIS